MHAYGIIYYMTFYLSTTANEIYFACLQERGELLGASKKAFEDGDKAKAKELSDKGKEAGHMMEESNKKAAEVILKHRNADKGPHYLDLHGLHLVSVATTVTITTTTGHVLILQ
jgi:hypothetical protein